MGVLDDLFRNILNRLLSEQKINVRFLQYHHRGSCKTPCMDCPSRDKKIYQTGQHIFLPAHPHCDCYYSEVETLPAGSISEKQPSPDVWLKMYGKLPDYYITKEEAITKYGWNSNKNTLAGKAPGKMIGGDIYYNDKHILPEKSGRVWYECDINYQSGRRNSLRLYYSNDGLMFYSPDHLDGNVTVYEIK